MLGISIVVLASTYPLACAMGAHTGWRHEDRPNYCERCGAHLGR